MSEINWNNPIELTEVFKFQKITELDESETKFIDGDMVVANKTKTDWEEYSRKTYITWEDIKSISAYPYKDDWKLKGEKYFIDLHSSERQILVLGNVNSIVESWTEFRNQFPPFIYSPNGMV